VPVDGHCGIGYRGEVSEIVGSVESALRVDESYLRRSEHTRLVNERRAGRPASDRNELLRHFRWKHRPARRSRAGRNGESWLRGIRLDRDASLAAHKCLDLLAGEGTTQIR